MSVGDLLDRNGIRLRSHRSGNTKARCPQCSDQRKHKRDPCLSVWIGEDQIKWCCHNCGWKGADREGIPEPGRETRRARRRDRMASWHRETRQGW